MEIRSLGSSRLAFSEFFGHSCFYTFSPFEGFMNIFKFLNILLLLSFSFQMKAAADDGCYDEFFLPGPAFSLSPGAGPSTLHDPAPDMNLVLDNVEGESLRELVFHALHRRDMDFSRLLKETNFRNLLNNDEAVLYFLNEYPHYAYLKDRSGQTFLTCLESEVEGDFQAIALSDSQNLIQNIQDFVTSFPHEYFTDLEKATEYIIDSFSHFLDLSHEGDWDILIRYAVDNDLYDFLRILLQTFESLRPLDSLIEGETFLHSALRNNNFPIIELLIRYNPNLIFMPNEAGRSALQIAREQNFELALNVFESSIIRNYANLLGLSEGTHPQEWNFLAKHIRQLFWSSDLDDIGGISLETLIFLAVEEWKHDLLAYLLSIPFVRRYVWAFIDPLLSLAFDQEEYPNPVSVELLLRAFPELLDTHYEDGQTYAELAVEAGAREEFFMRKVLLKRCSTESKEKEASDLKSQESSREEKKEKKFSLKKSLLPKIKKIFRF